MAIRVPTLKNENIVIRLAQNASEIEAADRLVCANYIECGLWDDDEPFRNNKHIHSPRRSTFIAIEGDKIIATASTIRDSSEGLPADKFQQEIMTTLRRKGGRIAEVTAVAVDKAAEQQRSLILFLFKFLYQYNFYYVAMDRFVAIVTPKHAFFYESICCFQKLFSADTPYSYVKLKVELLTLPLLEAHKRFSERYETDVADKTNFYRFMLVDGHPALQFPTNTPMLRMREFDWVRQAYRSQHPSSNGNEIAQCVDATNSAA